MPSHRSHTPGGAQNQPSWGVVADALGEAWPVARPKINLGWDAAVGGGTRRWDAAVGRGGATAP
jgi:hypothetical protein